METNQLKIHSQEYVETMSLEKENSREQALQDARRLVALWNAAEEVVMLEALEAAKQFISNGIELGYINMPKKGDTANDTLGIIDEALTLRGGRRSGDGGGDGMSHTPGPWRRYRDRTGRVSKIEGRGRRVCTFQPSDLNAEANASLIAAAPEMLEALEAVEIAVALGNAADDDPDAAREWLQAQTKVVELVEAVLKKVRGSNNGKEV